MSVPAADVRALPPQTKGRWRRAILSAPVGVLAALQFLTIAPPLIRRPFTPAELGRSVGWFPLVGLGLGAAFAGTDWLLDFLFPPGVTAALLLTIWVLATGALHLDGVLDSCDGIFGGRTRDARLRIMRDEHVGAYAVIGGVLVMLVKYACLAALPVRTSALLIAPTLGRWGMAAAVVVFPYARADGLGRAMKDRAGWMQLMLATVTAAVTAIAAAEWRGAIALAAAAFTTATIAGFVVRRLGGLTGDVYGAICEVAEAVTLLVFVAGESS
jgi:adenosylcobinamide-GDP ribazoletransferase